MINKKFIHVFLFIMIYIAACKTPYIAEKEIVQIPKESFQGSQDSTNAATMNWRQYFQDPYLNALIDSALNHNQELNIMNQEIRMKSNEVLARKGEYQPFVNLGGAMGAEKVGRYTNIGASEATTDIKPGIETPEPLPDFKMSAFASWEIDIWHKLRNAKKAAFSQYLASIEGKNFMVTNLIAEIANAYYELLALDNQLLIVNQNIEILNNAVQIVRLQKEATKVTELAVKKFEAEVYKTKSLQYDIQQQIVVVENNINFLVGRYPQKIVRSTININDISIPIIQVGIPSQLLQNRPDIRQAEQELEAAKLNVKAARANFYPSLRISAELGLQAFNPIYLVNVPKSLLSSLAGELIGPLINKNAIKATYYNANATQIQAVYKYERTVLIAFVEVANQLAQMENLNKSYEFRTQQVDALTQSIDIANRLFKFARADYMEVLMTQRDALESKFDLVETKKKQLNVWINLYKALGGGWNH